MPIQLFQSAFCFKGSGGAGRSGGGGTGLPKALHPMAKEVAKIKTADKAFEYMQKRNDVGQKASDAFYKRYIVKGKSYRSKRESADLFYEEAKKQFGKKK